MSSRLFSELEIDQLKMLRECCPQQNNWILQTNFREIVDHKEKLVSKINEKGKLEAFQPTTPDLEFDLSAEQLLHIGFNYMTENCLIALVLTCSGKLIFINNTCQITSHDQETEPPSGTTVSTTTVSTTTTDEVKGETVINTSTAPPPPKIEKVTSHLVVLDRPTQLLSALLLSKSMQKTIGLKQWSTRIANQPSPSHVKGKFLKGVRAAPLFDYSTFWNVVLKNADEPQLLQSGLSGLFRQWCLQSKGILNFECQTYLTETFFNTLDSSDPAWNTVNTVVFSQNCQIRDFSFLGKFSNLTNLEISECQQLDGELFSKLIREVPRLEKITIKYCCGLNLRIFIDLLKLDYLKTIAIDFPNFDCQPSPRQVLIAREEWRSLCSFTLEGLFINSENMSLDVLDYLLKSCSKLHEISLNGEVLKHVSQNILFDPSELRDDNTINFHETEDFQRGFRACKPLMFKNMFKNEVSAPYSSTMLDRIQASEGNIRTSGVTM